MSLILWTINYLRTNSVNVKSAGYDVEVSGRRAAIHDPLLSRNLLPVPGFTLPTRRMDAKLITYGGKWSGWRSRTRLS